MIDSLRPSLTQFVCHQLSSDQSLETIIYHGLYQAFLEALEKINNENRAIDRSMTRVFCIHIASLFTELKNASLTNFEKSNPDQVLKQLDDIIKNELDGPKDDFSKQQIDKLRSILNAHRLNLEYLRHKNYLEFTSHKQLEPGVGLISQGFFDKYPKATLAGSLAVASLPTIAYFCIDMFKDFVSNLKLPAPLSLALDGLVLGIIAYQFFKPKESIPSEGLGAAIRSH